MISATTSGMSPNACHYKGALVPKLICSRATHDEHLNTRVRPIRYDVKIGREVARKPNLHNCPCDIHCAHDEPGSGNLRCMSDLLQGAWVLFDESMVRISKPDS